MSLEDSKSGNKVVDFIVDQVKEKVEDAKDMDNSVLAKIAETASSVVKHVGPQETDPEIEDIIDRLQDYIDIDYRSMSIRDIPELVKSTMELVEDLQGLDGSGKKKLVTKVIHTLLDESDIAGSLEFAILPMIPVLIDQLIEVNDGKMKVNTSTKSLFGKMLACFKSCKECKKK